MNSLGVEFYRNYVGIEKPLKLQFFDEEYMTDSYNIELIYCNAEYVYYMDDEFYFHNVKPYLKTVEDLTDEEWLFVFDNNDCKWNAIKRFPLGNDKNPNRSWIEFEHGIKGYNAFNFDGLYFDKCDQELLNRLYSLHSHPQAKQLIEKKLANNKKDLKWDF